jgi:pseudaminic acid synthase
LGWLKQTKQFYSGLNKSKVKKRMNHTMNTSNKMNPFQIGAKTIGDRYPCFIVAELSANHNQKFELAMETIRVAKRSGADAIKLQTYTPDSITIDCDNRYFTDILKDTIWEGQKLYNLYKTAYTPWEWHEELFRIAKEEGLICFSSPFDRTAVDFLEQFNPPAYKIASFEIQDIPLIEYAASKGKLMILSTGIATLEDIKLAIKTCHNVGNKNIILLKCTSSYPAPLEVANLLTIPDLKNKFRVEVGLSDHTLGIIAPVVAVALGARMIEKHLILDKSIGGPDALFSLDEKEFAEMVNAVRQAELAIGKVNYVLTEKAKTNRKFGRSLFVVKDIKKGEIFTESNVKSIRPGFGFHPKYYKTILGTKAKKDFKRGDPLII